MRVLISGIFFFFSATLSSTYSIAEIPITTEPDGSKIRWVDSAKTGIKIPVGSSDTLICDPALLLIAKNKGLSSGSNCISLTNDGTEATNYVAMTTVTFGNFLETFAIKEGKVACDVIPDPWTAWSGQIPVASPDWLDPSLCGVQGYAENRVCTEPIHSCSNTCEGNGSTFTESRPASVDNGSAIIWSPTGATEVAKGSTCYQPDTATHDEINECGQPRTRTINCTLIPSVPNLSVPAGDLDGAYTVSWGAVAGAATYQVIGEGSSTIYSGGGTSVARSMPTGIYNYKVRACSAPASGKAAVCSSYSAEQAITVDITPAVPTITTPVNNSTGSYIVSWGSIAGASAYKLYEGTGLVHDSAVLSKGFSDRVTGVYSYTLRACNILGTCSAYSAAKTTRVGRIPAAPALSAPADDSDGSYPISWGGVAQGSTYQLYEGGTLYYNSTGLSVNISGRMTANYEYKVRSCNTLGDCGAFSVIKTVRVSRIPSIPALTVPANDADGSYSVSWGAVTHATTYQLVEGSSTVHNSNTRSKSFSGKGSAVYSYKVRSCNALGDCGAYSAVKTTRVSRIPAAPALTVPANDADGSYTISWSASTYATTYQLVEGSSTVHNSSTRSKAFSGKGSAVYSYKVRSCNALGDCGAYSTVKTTRVSRIPSVPALTVPANDADGSYSVSWGGVTHATTYQLVEGSSTVHNSSTRSKSFSGKGSAVYSYKVRSCNALGDCGAYSAVKTTRVSRIPAAPALTVPANDADGSYSVSWGAVTHATTYQLVEGSSTVHNLSTRSKAFSGKNSGVYSYKVRSCNALGDCGAYSAVKTTRVSRIPAVPALTVPANDGDGSYAVSWGAVPDATTYQLVEGSSSIHDSSTRSKAFSGKNSGVYSYKVRACNAVGDCGSYSAVKATRVSLQPGIPVLTVPSTDDDGSYTVSWGTAAHGATYKLWELAMGYTTLKQHSSIRSISFSGKSSLTYGYKVQACNALGGCGAMSAVQSVVVSTCDPNAWTPNNGLTVAQTAQTCTTGSTFLYHETNGCGGTKAKRYPCTGCNASSWTCTYGNGKTIAQCAAACNAPSTFPITNDCGGTVYYGGSAGQCTGAPPPPPPPQWSAWMGISRGYRFYSGTNPGWQGSDYQKAIWGGVQVYSGSASCYASSCATTWVHGGYLYESGGSQEGPYSYNYTTRQIRRKAL